MEWFFHIVVLPSVLARPIFSSYRHFDTWICDFLHCEISARNPTLVSPELFFLVWMRDRNLDKRAGAWFSPNHFVPLYSTGENRQKCQKEKPDHVDGIQGCMESLESGNTSFKEDTGKKNLNQVNHPAPAMPCQRKEHVWMK